MNKVLNPEQQRTAGEPVQDDPPRLRPVVLPLSREQARPGRRQPAVREDVCLCERLQRGQGGAGCV